MADLDSFLADARSRGFKSLVPQAGKKPCQKGPWMSYVGLSEEKQAALFAKHWPCEAAVVTGVHTGVICIDVDTHDGVSLMDAVSELPQEVLTAAEATLTETTPSGGLHIFFACGQKLLSHRLSAHCELKANQSTGTDKVNLYGKWLNPANNLRAPPWEWQRMLPILLDVNARRVAVPLSKAQQKYLSAISPDRARERATAYASHIRAVSKNGGHNATFSAACAIVARSVSEDDAWTVLQEWNLTNAEPPWSDQDLRHKLDDALQSQTLGSALIHGNPQLKDVYDGIIERYRNR